MTCPSISPFVVQITGQHVSIFFFYLFCNSILQFITQPAFSHMLLPFVFVGLEFKIDRLDSTWLIVSCHSMESTIKISFLLVIMSDFHAITNCYSRKQICSKPIIQSDSKILATVLLTWQSYIRQHASHCGGRPPVGRAWLVKAGLAPRWPTSRGLARGPFQITKFASH